MGRWGDGVMGGGGVGGVVRSCLACGSRDRGLVRVYRCRPGVDRVGLMHRRGRIGRRRAVLGACRWADRLTR